ncbi:hypothetical protein PGT21_004453 [Puccinia graminis f. sp. tritici]|uniref:Uncharacterized protein n=1 Tax=Puccinia graminis f. sp. tritici TaxID=56615 RepID=A0A5B0P3R2_PUCGR|nr:hypothetical protein PGT21_004453 [Puccinia graminis f. sp. tritici]
MKQRAFECGRMAPEAADERVAPQSHRSIIVRFAEQSLTVTLANTAIDNQDAHNCVGTKLDETRCCRKSAFNLKPNVPKGKFNKNQC